MEEIGDIFFSKKNSCILYKNNISLNSTNIFLNPVNNGGIIINRGDIYENNNLFEGSLLGSNLVKP